MRLLYLSHFFPTYPARFTVDEVETLRRQGLQVDVLAFRRPTGLHGSADGLSGNTIYISSLWREWLKGALLFLTKPMVAVRVGMKVATAPYLRRNDLRSRLHSLLTLLRSVAVVGLIADRGYTHVHSDFLDDTATCAWVARRFLVFELSIRDHLSYNPQLVSEKVEDASVVFACCDANRDSLVGLIGASGSKVVTNYLGVDTQRWSPQGGLEREDGLILCVATLQEKKGQRFLVQACADLAPMHPSLRCIFVGEGPDRSTLEGLVKELGIEGRVTFAGNLGEARVRELMERAAIFCLPSVVTAAGDSDGIPVALMEAMAMGLPCVSTSSGGIGELIEDQIDGLLVEQAEARDLVEVLDRLLRDAQWREALGQQARTKIERAFDLSKNAAELARRLTALPGV